MKDKLAICLSGLCICHCVLTPLLLTLGGLGVIGFIFGSEWVHYLLVVPIAVLAALSLPSSFRLHRLRLPLLLGAAGLLLVITALFNEGPAETWLTIAGSLLLCSAHYYNHYAVRRLKLNNPGITAV